MRISCSALLKYWSIVLAGISFFGCAPKEKYNPQIAFVSILPHQYIARRVAGDRFDIHVLIGPGQSPHSYTPSPGQVAKLSDAALFFRTGAEFEDVLIPKIKNTAPDLKIIDVRTGIMLRDIDTAQHAHGHEGHDKAGHDMHDHAGKDPHIWLSPPLMKTQAATIRNALVNEDPGGKNLYDSTLKALHSDLDSLNEFLHEILDPFRGTSLFVFHPSFGYFADVYGLKQVAVETGGKEPGAKALARLIDIMQEQNPEAIFVQPQFSQKSAQAIAGQLDCAVVPINPLPDNYLEDMREMGKTITEALK
ncbi:MAG: ABC transporter substrate-binding protein [Chitinivibrionales bacterium]|nr:ABC transporter substrate-binding protein [Chitinivibrionales bacterium]